MAIDVLLEAGVLHTPPGCPACGSTGIRLIRRHQYRCRDCRHEWSLRKDSILEGTRIPFVTFVTLAGYFAEDIPANDAAMRLNVAYNTVDHIYNRIRRAVIDPESADCDPATGNNERMDCTVPQPPGGTGTGGKNGSSRQVVFGIRLNNGKVTIRRVESPGPEIITSLPIPTIKRGNILFIDAYGKQYQGFISYAPDRHGPDIIRIRARQDLPWSPLADFWSFAGRTWMSHRGLMRERIPVFVQELAFRYNHRNADLFLVVLERVAAAYPPRDNG